jgi:hypothetical protein
MPGEVPPIRNPQERLAAQVLIALLDGDEEAGHVLLASDHHQAADAALQLGRWLIDYLEPNNIPQSDFRDDLAEGLRLGMTEE